MSTGDLYLSANVSGPPYCPRGYVRKGAVGESRSQRAARKVRFSDATRLWRLITVIGPAVITTTFKDTRAVSIQKYNNSKGAHRAISLKASRSFHNGARQPRLLREWRSYSFCHPFRERKSKRERERERSFGEEVQLCCFNEDNERAEGAPCVNWNVRRIIAADPQEF